MQAPRAGTGLADSGDALPARKAPYWVGNLGKLLLGRDAEAQYANDRFYRNSLCFTSMAHD